MGFLTRRAWVIARSDLRQLRHSRDFLLPLFIVALMFFVVLPALLFASVASMRNSGPMLNQLGDVVRSLPAHARRDVDGLSERGRVLYALAVYLFTPIIVIVPLTVSSAIGSHTLIGERERGSGEFLAHSPATEREIFTGKLLAALLPGYLTVFVGFAIYALLVNLIVGPEVGGWFFPTANWWFLLLFVVPPFLALVVAIILRISARVSSAAAAQQLSALVTLPLVVLAYFLTTSSLFGAAAFGAGLAVIAWIAALAMIWRGAAKLQRERLFGVGSG